MLYQQCCGHVRKYYQLQSVICSKYTNVSKSCFCTSYGNASLQSKKASLHGAQHQNINKRSSALCDVSQHRIVSYKNSYVTRYLFYPCDLGYHHVCTVVNQQQLRSFYLPNPFCKKQDFRRLDKLSPDYEMIYDASNIGMYILYSYPLIAFTMTIAMVMSFVSLMNNPDPGVPPIYAVGKFTLLDSYFDVLVVSPIAILFVYLSAMVASRFPLRMYYNEDTNRFIAIFATLFPWKVNMLEFEGGSVKHLYDDDEEMTTIIRSFRGEYILGKKRLSFLSHLFKFPYYYNVMLGYEVPNSAQKFDEEDK